MLLRINAKEMLVGVVGLGSRNWTDVLIFLDIVAIYKWWLVVMLMRMTMMMLMSRVEEFNRWIWLS